MTAGLDTQPTASTLDIDKLTAWVWSGRVRIPQFQRSMRWQRSDVIKLFDSILRGYPVGSLLLWHRTAEAEMLKLGALEIDAPAFSDALYVVDGQQRITSLANALDPRGQRDARFSLSYDLRNGRFVPSPEEVTDPTVVPLPVIFDLNTVLRWFADNPDAARYADEAFKITKTLRQFTIPAYEVAQEDESVLQEIFDRMNSYGKRLKRAEIFSALLSRKDDPQDDVRSLEGIAANVDAERDFGLIDNDTVLQAVLARRGPDVYREFRTEFGGGAQPGQPDRSRAAMDVPRDEDPKTAYAKGEEAIQVAVQFLQEEVGVPHVAFLPYRYLLVVLARFFAHYPEPDTRTRQLLRRWFWRAAVIGPELFRGSTSAAARQLNSVIRPGDLEKSIERLLTLLPKEKVRAPEITRFRSNGAATKILLCSWWRLHPRDLRSGASFHASELSSCLAESSTALPAVRYVISRSTVPREQSQWAANRMLYPTVEDDSGVLRDLLADDSLFALDGDARQAALYSHCLSEESIASLCSGDLKGFLNSRQAIIERQHEGFLRRQCEWDFEDTPSLSSLILDEDGGPDESLDLGDDYA